MLQSLGVLFIDKVEQVYAELISMLEIILGRLCVNVIQLGDALIICTLYHAQLAPMKVK